MTLRVHLTASLRLIRYRLYLAAGVGERDTATGVADP